MSNPEVFGDRVNVVEEIVALEVALERLQVAREVVEGLTSRLRTANEKIDMLRVELRKRADTIENMGVTMVDIAGGLARAGGQTHKDKDEILLMEISRLLAYGNRPPRRRDMDDIPF
jgi:hypothetical protein